MNRFKEGQWKAAGLRRKNVDAERGSQPGSLIDLTAVIVVALMILVSTVAAGAALRTIDMEGSAQVNPNWSLTDDRVTYGMVREADSGERKPLKDRANAFSGSYGLTFRHEGGPDEQDIQRTEYQLAAEPSLFPRHASRFIGFAVKVLPVSELPDNSNFTTLVQVFDAGHCSPPVSFGVLERNGTFYYYVRVRNYKYNRCVGGSKKWQYVVWPRPLTPGQWHRFVMEVKLAPVPPPDSRIGKVQVWRNGSRVGNFTGKVGLPSGRNYGEVKFGIYRGEQENTLAVAFDEVRFGTSRTSVDPDRLNFSVDGEANAAFVSQSVPLSLEPGGQREVSVTMRNTGSRTWKRNEFQLAPVSPAEAWVWGANRRPLTRDVHPGDEYTFSFRLVAPLIAGPYSLHRRIVGPEGDWVGEATPETVIQVTP